MSIDDKGDLASLKGPVADGRVDDKSISRGSISPKTSREGTPSPTSPEDLKGIVPLEHISCDGDYYSFPKPISSSPIPNLGTFKTTMQKKNGLVGSLALIGKLLDVDKVEAYVLCFKKEGWVVPFLERLITEDQDTQAEVLQKAFSCTEISNDNLLKLVKQCSLAEAEKLELSKERALKGDSMLLQTWSSKGQRLQWYEELIDKDEMNDRILCVDNVSRNEIFSLYVKKERWESASGLIVGRSFHEWSSSHVRIEYYRHLIDSRQIQKLLSYVNNSTRGEIFATLAEQEQWEEASKLSQQGDFHSWCRSEQRNVWYQKLIDSRNIALLKTNVNNRTRFEIFSVLIRNGRLDDASALIDRKNKLDRWCTLDQRIIWYQKLIDNGNIALLKAYVNDHTKLEIFSVLVKNGKFEEVAGVISDKSRFHKWCPEDQRKEWYQKLIQVGRKEDVFLWMNDRTKREVFSAFVIENQWDIAFSLFSGLPQSKTDYTPLNRVATVNEDSLYYKSVSDLCSHCIESGDEGKVAYLWRNLDSGLKRQLASKVEDKFGGQFLRNL